MIFSTQLHKPPFGILCWWWWVDVTLVIWRVNDLRSGPGLIFRPHETFLPSINLWCSFCMQLWTRQESRTDKHTDRHYKQIRDSHSITHLCPCLVHLSGKIHKMWILVSKSLYSNDDDKFFFLNQIKYIIMCICSSGKFK